MCAEGIRIGRKTSMLNAVRALTTTANLQLLKSRPSRITLVFAYTFQPSADDSDGVIFRAGPGIDAPIIGVVNKYCPTLIVDTERIGQLGTGEVWGKSFAFDATCEVTEIYLDMALSEAASQ